jgi:hypothetical protein
VLKSPLFFKSQLSQAKLMESAVALQISSLMTDWILSKHLYDVWNMPSLLDFSDVICSHCGYAFVM